jgi:hypothetical protein
MAFVANVPAAPNMAVVELSAMADMAVEANLPVDSNAVASAFRHHAGSIRTDSRIGPAFSDDSTPAEPRRICGYCLLLQGFYKFLQLFMRI